MYTRGPFRSQETQSYAHSALVIVIFSPRFLLTTPEEKRTFRRPATASTAGGLPRIPHFLLKPIFGRLSFDLSNLGALSTCTYELPGTEYEHSFAYEMSFEIFNPYHNVNSNSLRVIGISDRSEVFFRSDDHDFDPVDVHRHRLGLYLDCFWI